MRPNDELSSERGSRPSIQKPKVRPHTAIALACLEAAMPKGLKAQVKREALAILVQVPDASWSEAVVTGLKRHLPFPQPPSWIRVQRKRSDPSPFDKQEVASALAQGDCTIITTTSADACLSPVLTAFADVTITVTPPSASVLAQLLHTLVGRSGKGKPCAEIPEGLCNGLDLDEIAMAFRPGSAPEDVIRRLKLCQSAKQPSAPETTSSSWGIGAVPPLQELHGYGEAKAWGLELIEDLAAFQAGRIPFSALSARAVLASEPGLGKTSFVRSLAHSAGLPLVASSVATWFTRKSGHLGDVLSAIDQVFAEARERAPAIMFFDEIDALPRRTGTIPSTKP